MNEVGVGRSEMKLTGKSAEPIEGSVTKHSLPMRWCSWLAHRYQTAQSARKQPKRLRLCESLSLGERRFVAVVEFERSRFLIGGTQESLALLAPLPSTDQAGGGEREDRNQNQQDLKIWPRSSASEMKISVPGGCV